MTNVKTNVGAVPVSGWWLVTLTLYLMVWMFNMKVTFLSFALQSKNLILLEGFGQAMVTVYISQPGVSY